MRTRAELHGLWLGAVALGLFALALPASAQWTRVTEVTPFDVHSVWVTGDTIAAGADTAVFVSTDAGATWRLSAEVGPGVTEIGAVRVRNGRIYAGTFGQGVFVSNDLGQTWLGFSQGLVGGFADSQLRIQGLLLLGDSLYAATGGSGVWVRNLGVGGTWGRFGELDGDNTAIDVSDVAASDTRLLASAGGNGCVFFRDRSAPAWTLSFLRNVGFTAGLGPLVAAWTGHGWVVGSNGGLFMSPSGQEPWTPTGPDLGILFHVSFALRGRDLYADLGIGGGSVIALSGDDGATWQVLDVQNGAFIYELAINRGTLYAGRLDGLWRRSIATVSVPGGDGPPRLKFAIAGAQPIGDQVRFRFDLPAPGPIVIDVFDVAGRRAAESISGSWPAGSHEMTWDARGLGAGVYLARLTAGAERAVVRVVRAR